MPSSYTASLRLVLPATGELSGAWGSTVNAGLTSLVDTAIAGSATITMTTADYILTADNGAADEARSMFLVLQGTPAASRNVICPAVTKLYYVTNNTAFAQTLKTASGAGVSIPVGKTMVLRCDGTNVVEAAPHFGTLSASSTVSIDGGTFTFNSSAADRDARFAGTTDTNLLYIDASANAVGVGTATPFAKLHVAGTLRQNDTSGNYGYTVGTTTAKTVTAALASGGYFSWQTNLSGTDQMTLDTSGNLTVTGAVTASSLNGGQLAGMRNKIINGQFDIWQRGSSSNAAGGTFTADRWRQGGSTTGTLVVERTQTIQDMTSFGYISKPYCLRWNQSVAASSAMLLEQRIEDSRTLAGKAVTLSFIARLNSGSFSGATVQLGQVFGTGGSTSVNLTAQSLTGLTTSFQRFTFNFTLPEVGTKTIGAGDYLYVALNLPASGTWDFEITGVQLEAGSVATPFEQRPIGLELALCQRYLPALNTTSTTSTIGQGFAVNSTTAAISIAFPVTPRVAPTGISASAASQITVNAAVGGGVATAVAFNQASQAGGVVILTTSGLTTGQGLNAYFNSSSVGQILFTGCEL